MASKSTIANALAIQTVGRELEWKENLLSSAPSAVTDGTPLNASPVVVFRLGWPTVTGTQSSQVDVYLYYSQSTIDDAETGLWTKITVDPIDVGPGGFADRILCAGAQRIALVELTSQTSGGTLAGEVGRALVE